MYFNARYYQKEVGRFTSCDLIKSVSSTLTMNPYVYCANNPISYTDPTGLMMGGARPQSNPDDFGGGGGGGTGEDWLNEFHFGTEFRGRGNKAGGIFIIRGGVTYDWSNKFTWNTAIDFIHASQGAGTPTPLSRPFRSNPENTMAIARGIFGPRTIQIDRLYIEGYLGNLGPKSEAIKAELERSGLTYWEFSPSSWEEGAGILNGLKEAGISFIRILMYGHGSDATTSGSAATERGGIMIGTTGNASSLRKSDAVIYNIRLPISGSGEGMGLYVTCCNAWQGPLASITASQGYNYYPATTEARSPCTRTTRISGGYLDVSSGHGDTLWLYWAVYGR